MTRMLHTDEDKDKLVVFDIQWLFEGGDKAAIADIIGGSKIIVKSHNSCLIVLVCSWLDYFVTGYSIAQSNCAWEICFRFAFTENKK